MASTTTQSYYNTIPNDVIDKIILWSPAKSLLRFKCVCKYWFSLISDPNFVKTHAIHHSSSTTLQTHQIVVEPLVLLSGFRPGVVHRIQNCSTSTSSIGGHGDHHAALESVEVGCRFGSNYYYKILGSCNGIVCFSLITGRIRAEFSAWNPCTEEFKMFHKPPPINRDIYSHISYGFGYDYSINDYKLVCNAYKHNNIDDSFELFSIQVYTLGTDSWKYIDPADRYKCYSSKRSMEQGLFANGGGLYWIVKGSQSRHDIIICFDIKTEAYREVSKPWTPSHDVFMNIMNLGVLDGCLCMTGRDENKKYCVDVWMMKTKMNIDTDGVTGRVKEEEEEEEYSWIRYFTIRTAVIAVPGLQCLKPLRRYCHEENGDHHVLMMKVQDNQEYLVSYDPKLDKAIYPEWCSNVIKPMTTETTYRESLVSLKSGIYTRHHHSGSTVAVAVAPPPTPDLKRKRLSRRKPL